MSSETNAALVSRIDALLPQTQCTRCGYPACKPYAEAIAAGTAAINRCPPGGDAGITALADLLDQPPLALDPACGAAGPRLLARIDASQCIGCTKCIVACPVDAIIGGPRLMHTVLPALCSGCELCVPPCPVDCIAIEPVNAPWTPADAQNARERFNQREQRRQASTSEPRRSDVPGPDKAVNNPPPRTAISTTVDEAAQADRRTRLVAQAMQRARDRRLQRKRTS